MTSVFLFRRFTPAVLTAASLSGCTSLGRGPGEALLESTGTGNARQCCTNGRPFPGIEAVSDQR
jgi:hypothetical protein